MDNEREKELRHGLLLFESEQVTLKIDTVRDIFTHRHILKQSRFNIETLNHLAVLIRDGLKAKTRFRVFESLRVLRAQVLSASERLPNHTVKILFEIYQHLILESREEVQWCLSRLIKDQLLDDESIKWLTDQWDHSVHLVNRLLKYPVPNYRITEWARTRYCNGELADRRSEVIALLLSEDDITNFVNEEHEALGWGILQSHLTQSQKIEYLSSLVNGLSASALVTFAVRLNAPIILRKALESCSSCTIRNAQQAIRADAR